MSAQRFDDLPPKTKDFLTNLRADEVDTLNDGIRLVGAVRTVGTFVKWVIVGILGLFVGIVMLGESVAKIIRWLGHAAGP